jgi:hypothetical protein
MGFTRINEGLKIRSTIICTKDIDAAGGVNERPVIAFCYGINSQFVVS